MLCILIGQVFVALATGMGKVSVTMFLLRIVMKPWLVQMGQVYIVNADEICYRH